MLARLSIEFNQGANQVGDGSPTFEVVNTLTYSFLTSDIMVALTIATADVLENAFEIKLNLVGDLASSEEN